MGKKILIQIFVGIVMLVAGSVTGWLIKKDQDKRAREIRYVDLETNINTNIIGRPAEIEQKLEIMLDGKPINNLTQVEVKVFNLNDQDFKNIPIYIELTPEEGDSLNIISTDVSGSNSTRELIEENHQVAAPKGLGGFRYGYNIKIANRSDESPIYYGSFLIQGTKNIEIEVEVAKAGIELRDYEWENYYKSPYYKSQIKWYETDFFFIMIGIVVLAAYIAIVLLILRVVNRLNRKKVDKERKKIKELLLKDITNQKLLVPENLIDEFYKLIDKREWEKSSIINRLAGYVRKPKE